MDAEVTHVSAHGVWLLLGGDDEVLLPFADFPWFREATIAQIVDVERPSASRLYWPQLDIDLSVASIRRPSDFPLVAKSRGR